VEPIRSAGFIINRSFSFCRFCSIIIIWKSEIGNEESCEVEINDRKYRVF